MPSARVGSTGVFTSLGRARRSGAADTGRCAERASFQTLWLADVRGDLSALTEITAATTEIVTATAVLSIWDLAAADLARTWDDPTNRMVLGVGVSHPSMAPPGSYRNPLSLLENYLDTLEASRLQPIPCMIGANGPKMLELAGRRTHGAITQLVTPERTARQRECSDRPRRWPPRSRSSPPATRPIAAVSDGPISGTTCSFRDTRRICEPWDSTTGISPAGAATGSSTHWSPAPTRTRSGSG
ncbi:LLM class oxidoreductase [Gordonia amicalis]|uniref:Luciferase-like domain-containing protein n=1 Tax=Gordonia amicalis TaxID=89053 RepID=A0ABU4DJL3_9ACTN|nr:hypothetical protein [Gordonia amicalis]MDV6309951.1 hypothetical protein [Gordonia amicalis]UKO93399.1 hypothetical protein IHQ52_08890 [Gordonia amicalis]